MNAVPLRGKTIRRVHQKFTATGDNRRPEWVVEAIEFTDGSCLRFITVEADDGYFTAGIYPARGVTP